MLFRSDDHAARDGEVGGEGARRGKTSPDGQGLVPHETAKPALDLQPEGLFAGELELQNWSCIHARE